jgi:hypothetical protein
VTKQERKTRGRGRDMTKKEERNEVGEEREANKIVVRRWDTREMNEKVGV